MDFEAVIPIQYAMSGKVNRNQKLNITTGSLDLESILKELDEKPLIKSLDTSLDSGLQRRKRKESKSRLLTELESDLGPKFLMNDEAQSGNLRSKYGRLQKVNEVVVVAGYVPNDIFRVKRTSLSPVKSPKKALPPTPEKLTEDVPALTSTPPRAEEDAPTAIDTPETSSEKLVQPEEEDEQDEPMEIEQSACPDVHDANPESELIPTVKEEPVEVKQEMVADTPILLPPPPTFLPPPIGPILSPPSTGSRRISRRLSVWTPSTPPVKFSSPASTHPLSPAIVKQELLTPKVEANQLKEVENGVLISPGYEHHEKYLAVQHLVPGVLIWGMFSKCPPWPCMVCADERGIHIRQIPGKWVKIQVYVRFFGPKGLNSWISAATHFPFDPVDVADDLRYGIRLAKKPITEKMAAELNWAIEDAQVVAGEIDLTKRSDVFAGIINDQFNLWKQDKAEVKKKEPATTKRRRSSVASVTSDGTASRSSLDSGINTKKRIKLSTPVRDSHSSFSSALSTTSSSGVSTMSKLSDTLSVSSAGLGETDEDEQQQPPKQTRVRDSRKSKTALATPYETVPETTQVVVTKPKAPEETLEEKLTKIIKAIPVDIAEMKKEKRENLCRNCTRGVADGPLRQCCGSCGGLYHDQCLDLMSVSMERITVLTGTQKKRKISKKQRAKQRASLLATLEDEGVELTDDVGDIDEISTPFLPVTGDKMNLGEIPQMPCLFKSETVTVKCRACRTKELPVCFVCHKETPKGAQEMTMCCMANCGRAFHLQCLDKWPQAKKRKEGFVCPSHQCHLCISDDPRSQNFKPSSRNKLFKCVLCPTAYHLEQNCMPAGTEIIGNFAIICQRHFPLSASGEHRNSAVTKNGSELVEENNNNSTLLEAKSPVDETDVKVTPKKPLKKKITLPAQVNVNWCFICARGGSLLCCDKCPSAFHAECLKLTEEEQRRKWGEEAFICEECESGRFPLYGELVWAKFGSYRWWPAVIVSEGQVPANLNPSKRSRGEFCIKFLGSNDHAWIGRKRVFLYTDDDALLGVANDKEDEQPVTPKGKKGKQQKLKSPMKELTQWVGGAQKRGMDAAFTLSMSEARVMNQMMQERKQGRQQELSKLLRPMPYYKLKTNRPVAPVKLFELRADAKQDLMCVCEPQQEEGSTELVTCGQNSECLNRLLLTECNPAYCPAKNNCANQRLQRREYPQLEPMRTEGKGWGLVSKEDLKEGQLVVEYVGELINNEEMRRRIAYKESQKDDVYYFLTITKDIIIDAERKGNLARFMNHSCEGNCEAQKWTVNGNTRVGLFAKHNIKKDTELTFNYHWESTGTSSSKCHCGSKKCKGFIGGDPKRS